jgi:nucleobase:cation symporter-1, NCS1 family
MNALHDLLGGVLGGLAMLAAYVSTIAANALNDYTGGLSLQAAGVRIPRSLSAAVGAWPRSS